MKSIKSIVKDHTSEVIWNDANKTSSYIKKIFYFGYKYECPFCCRHFRKLLPYGLNIPVLKEKHVVGGMPRPNAICPHCFSSDRERLVYLYMLYRINIFRQNKKIKVLHVAPEKNLQKILFNNKSIDYISADLNSPLVDVKMDITDIQYEDNFFDVIICNHVLEHIEDDIKAMSELYRVSNNKFWSILQVPLSFCMKNTYEDSSIVSPKEREEVFGQYNHVRIYSYEDYKKRLENVGFHVNGFKWIDQKRTGIFLDRYALNHEEVIIVVTKRK